MDWSNAARSEYGTISKSSKELFYSYTLLLYATSKVKHTE